MRSDVLRIGTALLKAMRGPAAAGTPPAGGVHVLRAVAGAEVAIPWRGLISAAASVAGAAVFVSTLLCKLILALLIPVAAGWIVARLAPCVLPERLHGSWTAAWSAEFTALGLGLAGAAAFHQNGLTPAELITFTRFEITSLVGLAWGGALALPLAIMQRQAYRHELTELRLSAVNAELKALQAQVEPHFLYNTLANTRYLARHQPERAVDMLDHLIAYLHQALPDMRSRTSTTGRECELAGHYLALMAIRFGSERMRYAVHVAADVPDADMPPLLLISLVENAVRHGVEASTRLVTVEVHAVSDGDRLRLSVIDDGPGPGATAITGSGVGLRNCVDRLRALYGSAASLALTRGADQRTCAELVLPLKRPLTKLSAQEP